MATVPLVVTGWAIDTQTGAVTVTAVEGHVGDHPDPVNFGAAMTVQFRLNATNLTYLDSDARPITPAQAATLVEGQKTRPTRPAGSR